MKEIFLKLFEQLQAGQDVVMVTIIASGGSAPRKSGSRMLINKEGLIAGTIGGGAVEYQSQKLAETCLAQKKTVTHGFLLSPNQVADIGMICGGQVTVLCQYFSKENAELVSTVAAINQALADNLTFQLFSSLTAGDLRLYLDGKWSGPALSLTEPVEKIESGIVEAASGNFYAETFQMTGQVFVFGGGHVAQALVPVLHFLNFSTVVLDDRPDFLTETLFPLAEERILVDLTDFQQQVKIGKQDYAVVMTRGHLFDLEIEEQLLQTEARYIGVMGSRHKVAAHIKKLQEKGFAKSSIQRLTMPIGLAIGAQTPEELAISIAGQLIEVRSQV
ncbi:XdhC family protein [Enterococcus sp. LJL120]